MADLMSNCEPLSFAARSSIHAYYSLSIVSQCEARLGSVEMMTRYYRSDLPRNILDIDRRFNDSAFIKQ